MAVRSIFELQRRNAQQNNQHDDKSRMETNFEAPRLNMMTLSRRKVNSNS